MASTEAAALSAGPAARLAVIGSINVDHVVRVPSLPAPGETVLGTSYALHHGGKGANLAVAAARLGADVSLVGAVGTDGAGAAALAALAGEGVDVSAVVKLADEPTGAALIVVDEAGENQIAVARSANRRIDPDAVTEAIERIRPSVVSAVLEVPMEAVLAAATMANRNAWPFVLSAAPAVVLPAELLANGPIVCVNAGELAMAVEAAGGDGHAAAAALLRRGAVAVLVTLGAGGVELVTAAGSTLIAGVPVADVVDTTGAGDTFAGAVAAFLAGGAGLEMAARRANTAAALSVRRAGAREGMPSLAELEAVLASG